MGIMTHLLSGTHIRVGSEGYQFAVEMCNV
jgi:hypothetical protein